MTKQFFFFFSPFGREHMLFFFFLIQLFLHEDSQHRIPVPNNLQEFYDSDDMQGTHIQEAFADSISPAPTVFFSPRQPDDLNSSFLSNDAPSLLLCRAFCDSFWWLPDPPQLSLSKNSVPSPQHCNHRALQSTFRNWKAPWGSDPTSCFWTVSHLKQTSIFEPLIANISYSLKWKLLFYSETQRFSEEDGRTDSIQIQIHERISNVLR